MAEKLSTKPYKGTRDFYPEEMRLRTFLFGKLGETVESYGFEKIDAPLVEPVDLYLAKTSEEIVNQQIYSFEDRGNRKVAIRPEMTPTVARMVSARARELPRPIRWYSMPNLWRYEQPGRGRLREHWQLNCDILGAPDEWMADLEILTLAINLLNNLGADETHFQLYLSHRELLNAVFSDVLSLPEENWPTVARAMDKRAKIAREEYVKMLQEANLSDAQIEKLDAFLDSGTDFLKENSQLPGAEYILKLLDTIRELSLDKYVSYNPAIVRGFDYYTGIVFEVFDKNPENRRSLFGGGRYDKLVNAFINEEINAVGFGMGDVTLKDFLETHKLLPQFPRAAQIYVAHFGDPVTKSKALQLSILLRKNNFIVEMSLGPNKVGKQFKEAAQKEIPVVILQGEEERQREAVQIKDLRTGEQSEEKEENLINSLKSLLS